MCCVCVHPLSACQSGLKVVVYRTNVRLLESRNERCDFLHISRPFVPWPCSSCVHLIAVIKRRSAHFPLKRMKNSRRKKRPHQTQRPEYFFIYCLPKEPASKVGINGRGRGGFVVVILLVLKRKVLSSPWDGCDVISVRKDICSALSHIRVNFPGADASQHGDLFILYGGFLGPTGSARCCWHS